MVAKDTKPDRHKLTCGLKTRIEFASSCTFGIKTEAILLVYCVAAQRRCAILCQVPVLGLDASLRDYHCAAFMANK